MNDCRGDGTTGTPARLRGLITAGRSRRVLATSMTRSGSRANA